MSYIAVLLKKLFDKQSENVAVSERKCAACGHKRL